MDGDLIEATVEKLVPGGEGLARVDGQAVFVPGGLPGERIRAPVADRRRRWMRTGSPRILEASDDRREAFCPLFGECGGCLWQHLEYSAQLRAKESFVREALARQGGIPEEDQPAIRTVASRPRNYRCRIRPRIRSDGRPGFRASGSHRVVPIPHCPIAVDAVNDFFADPRMEPGGPTEPVVFGQGRRHWVSGRDDEARAELGGRTFRFPPDAFFQSNLDPLEDLVDFVLSGIDPDERRLALDLYGGVGLFGSYLADRFDAVIGVERDRRAREAWIRHVGIRGTFHTSSLEAWATGAAAVRPDFIVVDPPRSGLSPPVRGTLKSLAARNLAYVSCDPVTQARDLYDLGSGGYRIAALGLFDLYPQTPHVETVALLRRDAPERST